MEELYVAITHLCRRAVYLLASALCALRDLPAADAWLWLVRAAAPGGLAAKIIKTGAVNGRVKVSQRAAQNVATLGFA